MRCPWDTTEGAILTSVLAVFALTMFGVIIGGSK